MEKITEAIKKFTNTTTNKVCGNIYDEFQDCYKSTQYVDKSLFISEFFKLSHHTFLTAPEMWGKSLNLSMLKAFLSPDIKNKKRFKNGMYDFSKGGNSLVNVFQQLKIGQDAKIMEKEGQFPVIYLNFKDAFGCNSDELQYQLRKAVSNAFKDHTYLYEYLQKQKPDIAVQFRGYMLQHENCTFSCGQVIKLKIYEGISFLNEQLQLFFERKTILLVDEFDRPVRHLYQELLIEQDPNLIKKYQETIKQITQLLQAIVANTVKGNITTEKAMLTGILNIFENDPSGNLNGLWIQTLVNSPFSAYFGFNENEIHEQILKPMFEVAYKYNFQNEVVYKLLFQSLQYWYNGFNLVETQGLYNPFSVMSAISGLQDHMQPKVYWIYKATNQLMNQIIQSNKMRDFNERILSIIQGKMEIQMNFSDFEGSSLSSYLNDNMNSEDFEKLAFSMFIQYGYLTITNNRVCLPGNEQKYIFIQSFLGKYIQTKNVKASNEQVYNILERNDIDFKNFIEGFLKMLKQSKQTESQLQSFMYCIFYGNLLVNSLNDQSQDLKYDIQLERSVSYGGRIDTIFFPFQKKEDGCVIIHEYKKYDNDNDLQKRKDSALWQIILGNYLRCALEEKQKYSAEWSSLILRGMIFYIDHESNWHLDVKQQLITFEQANTIQKWYDQDKKIKIEKNNKNYETIKNEICEEYDIKNFDEFISLILNEPIQNEQQDILLQQNLVQQQQILVKQPNDRSMVVENEGSSNQKKEELSKSLDKNQKKNKKRNNNQSNSTSTSNFSPININKRLKPIEE